MARKGKYAAVVGQLPRLSGVEPERRDLVNQVKEEILTPAEDRESNELNDAEADYAREKNIFDANNHVREAIRLIKQSTGGRRWASEFARAYANARDLRDQIDDWRSSANMLVEAFQELMIDQMEQEGLSAMKLDSGRPITTYQEPYAQVSDREAFRQWCEADPDLRGKMALPWMSTNALVKEMLLRGEDTPPGVEVFAKTAVRLGSGT